MMLGVAPAAADCLSARQALLMARYEVGAAALEEMAASERYIATRAELEAARLRREREERRARYAARDHAEARGVCRHLDDDRDAVRASLIDDDYERTNVWKIHPAHHSSHPAVFPDALAERVIRYYSFKDDMVLDPFSGTGTTGRVAGRLERRFFMIEKSPQYFQTQKMDAELQKYAPQVWEHKPTVGVE